MPGHCHKWPWHIQATHQPNRNGNRNRKRQEGMNRDEIKEKTKTIGKEGKGKPTLACGWRPSYCPLTSLDFSIPGTRTSYLTGTESSLPQGREADRSVPTSSQLTNVRSFTSTSPYVFVAWCIIYQSPAPSAIKVASIRNNFITCVLASGSFRSQRTYYTASPQ